MKLIAALLTTLIGLPFSAIAQEAPFDPVKQSAYVKYSDVRVTTDEVMAKADAILDSRFTSGSPLDYNNLLREAAISGHPKAQFMLCALNSNEMLGSAFFRDAYVWCKISSAVHRSSKPQVSRDSDEKLAYVVSRLQSEGLAHAQENEEFILDQMQRASVKASAIHP